MLEKTEVAKTQILSASISEGTEIAGRYRILSLIGEGGMGAVYRAQHLQLRKVFALKVLHPHNVARPEVAARFEREAIAAGRIEHPNVVPATDFGMLPDGSFFLVLEFVNGRSLRSELKSGAMRPSRALGIMRGVIAGVRAAHEKGVVHRDLKPENIMLVDREGNRDFVKLLDFGVARLDLAKDGPPQLTEAGAMLGTPQYMSPEQILGRAVDARTDLYSLGIVLFELLTGRCPFSGNLATLLQQHVVLPAPELPAALAADEPRLAEIVRVLLSKEPDNRFQTAKALAAATEEASSQRASRARVAPAASPAQSLLAKLVSSTSALGSFGVSKIRRYMARFESGRRARSLARAVDRGVARSVVAARQVGRQTMTVGRKLAAAARVAWTKSIESCRSHWRIHARSWTLALGAIGAVGLIFLLTVAIRSCQGGSGPEESKRPDRTGAKRPLPSPAKTGSSKSHR